MKKEFKLIFIIIISILALIWLWIPLNGLFDLYLKKEQESELLAKIINRFFLIILLFVALKKLKLSKFNGIYREEIIRNKSVLAIPILLIFIGLWANLSIYIDTNIQLLLLFSIHVFFVGLFEEICFRGLILPLFINGLKDKKYALYLSVLFSGLAFGLLHYMNLFLEPENFWGITSQVYAAISFGVVLGALMLRTGNILVVSLCHAFTNFVLGNSLLNKKFVNQIVENSSDTNLDWVSLIATILIFGIIFLGQDNLR